MRSELTRLSGDLLASHLTRTTHGRKLQYVPQIPRLSREAGPETPRHVLPIPNGQVPEIVALEELFTFAKDPHPSGDHSWMP